MPYTHKYKERNENAAMLHANHTTVTNTHKTWNKQRCSTYKYRTLNIARTKI